MATWRHTYLLFEAFRVKVHPYATSCVEKAVTFSVKNVLNVHFTKRCQAGGAGSEVWNRVYMIAPVEKSGPKANSLHTLESLRRRTCCYSQPVTRMLATLDGWLTDSLTGAIKESRKAARSKVVASPPLLLVSGKHALLCNSFQWQQIKVTGYGSTARGTQRPATVKQILPRIFYYLRTAKTSLGDLFIHVEFSKPI